MKPLKTAAVSGSLLAALVMSACGTSTNSSSSSPSSPSSASASQKQSSEAAAPSQSESQSPSSTSSDAPSTESSSPSSSSSQSSSSSPVTSAKIPAGYQKITAPTVGISFAVPSSWKKLTSSEEKMTTENMKSIANQVNLNPDQIPQILQNIDVWYINQDAGSFRTNINTQKQTFPMGMPASKQALTESIVSVNGSPGEFKEYETALGKGSQLSYTLPVGNSAARGVMMCVPDGTGQSYALITVSAGEAKEAADLASKVAQSLSTADKS